MKAANRRYDIDWLRVIAIGLLLIYHITIAFQPWGVFIGFIQSAKSLEWLWIPMSMLNVWRIPLLFFVSGMGVYFAIRKRNLGKLILERTQRILVPFVFGIFCIVPLHLLLFKSYYSQDLNYTVNVGHLWFLANIFIYVVLLSPLFFFLKKNENGKLKSTLVRIFSNPLGMILIAACFIVEAVLVKPETYETYAMTLHGFFLGFLAFLFGFIIVFTGESTRRAFIKWRWITLILAAGLYIVRYSIYDMLAPGYLLAFESNMWIFTVFGFAFRYLNRPGKALAYFSQAAYPVYILHMIFLYLGSMVILPMNIPAFLQFILIVVFTFAGCLFTYEFIIKRVIFLRPLFGLKIK